jgi:hypothetical protein
MPAAAAARLAPSPAPDARPAGTATRLWQAALAGAAAVQRIFVGYATGAASVGVVAGLLQLMDPFQAALSAALLARAPAAVAGVVYGVGSAVRTWRRSGGTPRA